MGLMRHMSSGCSTPTKSTTPAAPTPPNPDPADFKIVNYRGVGRFVIATVQYPACTTFEGLKILVYQDVTAAKLALQTHLDPHFCEHRDHIAPVARFEPTYRGMRYAVAFCQMMTAATPVATRDQ